MESRISDGVETFAHRQQPWCTKVVTINIYLFKDFIYCLDKFEHNN